MRFTTGDLTPRWRRTVENLERFLYYPERIPGDAPLPYWARGAQEIWVTTEDGVKVHGLWWDEPAGAPVVLFFHGNAQDVFQWSPVHDELAPLECRMLLMDYPGYGKSEGEPSEKALYSDGRAALQWLRDNGVDDGDIVVFGKSLGGAVACGVCPGLTLRGLVLESTFTSLLAVSKDLFPFMQGELPGEDVYHSAARIKDIHCPVLVVHGDADALIPVSEGLELFEAANEPKELVIVRGAGHNDVSLVGGEAYAAHIRQWLDTTG